MSRHNLTATKNLKDIFKALKITFIKSYSKNSKYHDKFLSIVRKQLNAGANPNIRFSSNNITPLMWAVKHNYLSLVKLLLRNDGNPLLKDSKGRTLFDQHYSPKGMSKKCLNQAKKIINKRRITKKYLFDNIPIPPRPRLRRYGARQNDVGQSKPIAILPIIKSASQRPVWKSKPLRPVCSSIRCDYNYLVYDDADAAYAGELEAALAAGEEEDDAIIAAEKAWDEALQKGTKSRPHISVNKYCKDSGCHRCAPPKGKGVRYCT
ncbi:ankyrin repeat domain-containing protein [Aureispira]|nr:ankyrin repeat domain-containing protein [Aureispira sp.]